MQLIAFPNLVMILKELKLIHKWFGWEKLPKIVRKPSQSGEFGGKCPNAVINIHDIDNDYYVHPSCPWSPEYQWQHK